MGKKSKEPNSSLNHKIDSSSPSSSNIFKTLLGDIPEEIQGEESTTFSSIFSDSNPFRRKPTDSSEENHESVEKDENRCSESPNTKKKRKREEDKRSPNLDSDYETEEASGIPLEVKKPKKGKNPNADVEKEEVERNPSKDVVSVKGSIGDVETKGRKKKRKREEIEAEYEEKRYGVIVKDDDVKEGGGGGAVVGEKRKKLDSPEEMLVSKEGFDDVDKLLRTVFVGNLPLKVKKKALLREFSQFGEIESVRLRSIPLLDDKTPRKGAIMKKQINDAVDRVNAYIVYKKEDSAQASLSHNMAVFGGNHIHVDRACPPRKKLRGENAPLYDSKRTVFVGNLPFDVKDEEIYQLFTGLNNLKSSIEAIRVIRDAGTSMGKGIAYVLFKTTDAVNAVIRKHNLKIRERELRLSRATSNSTPKRKDSLPAEKYKSPAKKYAVGSTTPDSNNKVISSSYQGMRASKSGVQKKVSTKTNPRVKLESRSLKVVQRKEWAGKRPAVAARKANANAAIAGGGSVKVGKKRKAESRTPQSNRQNKKSRNFK